MFIELKADPLTTHYAIGDVHGCLLELEQALQWCSDDALEQQKNGIVILLGDYIDRGPRSADVINLLIEGPKDSHMKWIAIKGNHDDLMAKTWFNPNHEEAESWWQFGGQQTLMSYGWDPLEHAIPYHLNEWIPESHARFLDELPIGVETNTHLFVHAGIRPLIPIKEQDPNDLMKIRGLFYTSGYDCGKPVVHGHTPNKNHPHDYGFRVALDSGCFQSGLLSVAAFDYPDPKPRFKVIGLEEDPCPARGLSM